MGKKSNKKLKLDLLPPRPPLPEVKKMKKGMVYSCKEKIIILNVFKFFRIEDPDMSISEVVRRTARATGCGENSIYLFRKEEGSVGGLKEPNKKRIRKGVNTYSRDVKYNDTVRQAIRNIIYDLKCRSITPSLKVILEHIKSNPEMPTFSLSTLGRLICEMGFMYKKNGNKHTLVEKSLEPEVPVKKKKTKATITSTSTTKRGPKKKVLKILKHYSIHPNSDPNIPINPPFAEHKEHFIFYDNRQNCGIQMTSLQQQTLSPPETQHQQQQQQQQQQEQQQQHQQQLQPPQIPALMPIRQMTYEDNKPILPISIHHRDMQLPNASPKLMMLSNAQPSAPWS